MKKFLLGVLSKTILTSKTKVPDASVSQLSCFLQVLSHLIHVMTEAILRSLMVALSTVSIPCQSHTTIHGYLLLDRARADPIWSCDTCFTSFHINCIQRWANDSIFQQKQQLEDDPQKREACLLELPQVQKLPAPNLHPPAPLATVPRPETPSGPLADPSLLWRAVLYPASRMLTQMSAVVSPWPLPPLPADSHHLSTSCHSDASPGLLSGGVQLLPGPVVASVATY